MKSTTKQHPELMCLICNIQAMKSKIYPGYDPYNDFRNLDQLTGEQLHRLQDRLIPEYNKAIQTI